MLRLLKIDLRYHRFHILIVSGVVVVFGLLINIFEPPSREEAFGMLALPSLMILSAYVVIRSRENRNYDLLNLPVSHLDVFLARHVFVIIVMLLPYTIALLAYALRGQAIEAVFQLLIPSFTRYLLLVSVFLLQMDLKNIPFNAIAKTIFNGFLSVLQVLLLWAMFFYPDMSRMITKIGGEIVVDLTLKPLHQVANDPYILLAAIVITLVHYCIFTLEQHPQNSRCL